jgi:hypothetical protein
MAQASTSVFYVIINFKPLIKGYVQNALSGRLCLLVNPSVALRINQRHSSRRNFYYVLRAPTKLYRTTVVLDVIFHTCVLGQRNLGFPLSFQEAVRFQDYCLLGSDVI